MKLWVLVSWNDARPRPPPSHRRLDGRFRPLRITRPRSLCRAPFATVFSLLAKVLRHERRELEQADRAHGGAPPEMIVMGGWQSRMWNARMHYGSFVIYIWRVPAEHDYRCYWRKGNANSSIRRGGRMSLIRPFATPEVPRHRHPQASPQHLPGHRPSRSRLGAGARRRQALGRPRRSRRSSLPRSLLRSPAFSVPLS